MTTTTTSTTSSTVAAPGSRTTPTIADLLQRNARTQPERSALRWHQDGEWLSMSWGQYGEAVDEVAAGLVSLGLEPGDCVGVLSNNRVEWHLADIGTISARGVTVPVYQTNSSSQVAYVLGHSDARFCFVENQHQLSKILLRRPELPKLERIFLFEPVEGLDDPFISTIGELREMGADALEKSRSLIDERRAATQPDDLATIVYTSGTTGPPKGTMISHRNITTMVDSVTSVVSIGPEDRFLSFLPLSHVAERIVSDCGQIISGGETWFARSLRDVPEDLKACRPTVFFAVPRVWEKFQEAVLLKVDEAPKPLRRTLEHYIDLGLRRQDPRSNLSPFDHAQYLALDQTIGRSIRSQMGLNHARILAAAAAPIHPDLLHWFAAIGLHIGEAYGQTEGTGVTSVNPPEQIRIGTVGPPVANVQVRIAEDGEILVRGDNVTPGYLNDDAATAELIDEDGWMHSGDLGELDTFGYLRITGRKKDLIINAAGKNISPQEIETALRYEPLISQAIVVGDARPYLVALLTLDEERVKEWADENHKHGTMDQLRDDPELLEEVEAAVGRVNAKHARVEGIKRWALLPHDLSVESGELTPTLKVKRKIVTSRYAEMIDRLYAG